MAWADRFAVAQIDQLTPAFYDGREFRTFKELVIPALGTYVIRCVVPLDIVFSGLELSLDAGYLRVGTYVGGTPGGVFAETLPRFCTNNMAPGTNHRDNYPGIYAPQTLLTAGGTHTGGTELDVQRIKVNEDNKASASIGNGIEAFRGDRGVAVGTYYFRFLSLNSVPVKGVFRARWEEKP